MSRSTTCRQRLLVSAKLGQYHPSVNAKPNGLMVAEQDHCRQGDNPDANEHQSARR
jgi:hypothetical protein